MATNIEIRIGNRTRQVVAPESWNDLDARRLFLYYSTLFSGFGDEFTAGAFTAVKLISLTQDVLKAPADFLTRWEADCLREDPEFGQTVFLEELKQVIGAALAGLFDIETDTETGSTSYAVRFTLTRNPWPSLSHTPNGAKGSRKKPKTTVYYAPKDGLENITLYEMAYTFSLYENYVNSRDEQYADRLIAALYRPSRPQTRDDRESDWHGDRRQPLRRYEGKVEERAALVGTLPVLTRRLIVFWFAGCREAIVKRYPKVFRRAEGGDPGPGYGWGGLLLQLAESGTFGALDQTSDQHYSNALTYLSMKEDDRMRIEKEIAKKKRA